MKKEEIVDGACLLLIAACLLLGGVSLLFFPAPRFSESENRLLAEKPRFTWQSLTNGSYTAAWESYASERMRGRHLMRGVYAATELGLGKREVNDVILGTDGSLTKRLTANARIYHKNLDTVSKFSAKAEEMNIPFTAGIAPRRMDVRTDILPRLYRADTSVYQPLHARLPNALVLDGSASDAAWFRTDHHWTVEGAYAAYVALGEHLGYTPHPRADFSTEVVSHSFWGTTDAAAGIIGIAPDKIELWRFSGDEAFHLTKDGEAAHFSGFYDRERLKTRDGYAVFLGGNAGITEITLGEADTRPTLLVVKDSFANALLPFLARHYRITAIDPRYTAASPTTLLPTADRALLLCGMQTLTEIALCL